MKQQNLLGRNDAWQLLCQRSESMLLEKARQDTLIFYIKVHTAEHQASGKLLEKARQDTLGFYTKVHTAKHQAKTVEKSVMLGRTQEFKELLTLTDIPRLECFLEKNRLSESEEYQLIVTLLMDMDDEKKADEIIRAYFWRNGFHSAKVRDAVKNAGISLDKPETAKNYEVDSLFPKAAISDYCCDRGNLNLLEYLDIATKNQLLDESLDYEKKITILGKHPRLKKDIKLIISYSRQYLKCYNRYYQVPARFYDSAEITLEDAIQIIDNSKK